MLKRLLWSTLASSLVLSPLLLSSMALAAPPDNAREKFYNFGESVFDGQRLGPAVTLVDGVERPEFQPLLSWKKSFLPRLHQSRAELR